MLQESRGRQELAGGCVLWKTPVPFRFMATAFPQVYFKVDWVFEMLHLRGSHNEIRGYLGISSKALGNIVASWLNLPELCLPNLFDHRIFFGNPSLPGYYKKDKVQGWTSENFESIMDEAFLSSLLSWHVVCSPEVLRLEEGMFVWPGQTAWWKRSPWLQYPPPQHLEGSTRTLHFFFFKSEK